MSSRYNKCNKHPEYLVTEEPQSDCERCWEVWLKEFCDANEVEIKAGQKVAYNKEGKVVPGRVIKVGTKTKYGYQEPVFEIEMLVDNTYWHKTGHISKVNNAQSILVLNQE